MIEKIGVAAVADRKRYMHGFTEIEAGMVFLGGKAYVVAICWSSMSATRAISPVSIADFPAIVGDRFPKDCVYPTTDEEHWAMIGFPSAYQLEVQRPG